MCFLFGVRPCYTFEPMQALCACQERTAARHRKISTDAVRLGSESHISPQIERAGRYRPALSIGARSDYTFEPMHSAKHLPRTHSHKAQKNQHRCCAFGFRIPYLTQQQKHTATAVLSLWVMLIIFSSFLKGARGDRFVKSSPRNLFFFSFTSSSQRCRGCDPSLRSIPWR